jgi:iron complex transport system permease protein
MPEKKLETEYGKYIRFKRLFLIIMIIVMLVIALVAIASGSSGLTLGEVINTILGNGTAKTKVVVFNLRLPRIVTAVVAGIGLAVVGCVMQSILRNPLASSSTLGVSQGAAFGAAFAIIALDAGMQSQTLDGVAISNPYTTSICAFVGSMLSTLVVLGLSRIKKITPQTMILSGVALSSLFSGGTTLLQYFADDVKVAAVVFWTFGSLGSTSWREIIIMSVVVAAASVFFLMNRWNYNAIQGGESTAKGLGVNTDRLLLVSMVVCSATASVIVSYIGIINFIGLIAPHLMRRVVGSDYRYLLPASALMGAVLLLLSDTVARLIVQPVVLPIGAITSFLGAPLFLYLIFKGGKRR